MASPIEQAVVELQIIIREFNRRLHALERRMGMEPESLAARVERPQMATPLPPQERRTPQVSRTARSGETPYDIAGTPAATLAAEPATEGGGVRAAENIQVTLSEPPGDAAGEKVPPPPVADAPQAPVTDGATADAEDLPVEGAAAVHEPDQTVSAGREIPLGPAAPPKPQPPATRVMQFIHTYPPPAQHHGPAIESTLGAAVTSWLGAFAITGAVLVFLKYAFVGGGLALDPQPRVILALVLGVGMIVHGQWLHIRNLRPLSSALSAAGLAITMTALLAAYAAFSQPVLSQEVVFLAVPAAGALGVLLALQNRAQTLAVLAFAGMYLSPLVLNNDVDNSVPFLVYLFVLAVGGLALASIRPKWESLRIMAFAGSWIWLIAWGGCDLAKAHGALGIVAGTAFFLLFLVEMTFNLLVNLDRDPVHGVPATARAGYAESFVTLQSFANTGLAFFFAWQLFTQARMPGLWSFALGMASLLAVLALSIRSRAFSISTTTQAMALVIVAIGLGNSGATLVYALSALGFGLYARNRPGKGRYALAWMVGLMAAVALRICAFDAFDEGLQQPVMGAVSPWMLGGWMAGLLSLVLAYLGRPEKDSSDGEMHFSGAIWAAVGCIAIATLLIFVVNLRALPMEGPFTCGAVIWVFVLIGLSRVKAFSYIAPILETLSSALLMGLSAKWFLADGIAREFSNPQGNVPPLFNLFTLNALLLAAAVLILGPAWQGETLGATGETGRRFVAWWLAALAFAWLSVQTLCAIDFFMPAPVEGLGSPELVKSISLTAVWSLYAAGMIFVGLSRNSSRVRYVALVLLGFTLAKILVMDLANSQTTPRTFLLLIVGILLFLISYVYHKSAQNRLNTKQSPAQP